ncbi:uncharacterized protein ATC70_009942 [Mucor velutinosus]|uniref:Uncharacterized protein n=1 Tax=Mucor velutinosus TaxID=708070 RepID=A0AAN7DMH4_9FUNG|nr:hypothetical protein ATC70_009942 [Mucor velutinosus]
MFKSKKKRLQQKQEAEAAAAAAAIAKTEAETSKYKLLDDIHLTHDFRSSVILPQLNKDIDPQKLVRQQEHLASLRDIPETLSPPLSPPPTCTSRSSSNGGLHENDGSKQYQDLAAWRHQRSQNRYSNGLFGGKQRGRPKPSASRWLHDITDQDVQEETIHENPETDITPPPVSTAPSNEDDIVPSIQFTREALALDQDDEDDEDDEYLDDQDELQHEEYEPESDTEENFFFQDFSGNSKPKKRTTNNLNGRRRRSQKVMSKFDLSSFARDLHDHRLSVIQPRESRIIMTEDDELELEKLLERQRQRMSMMTMSGSTDSFKVIPPLPSLDLIKPHTTTVLPSPSLPTPVQQAVTKEKEITEDLEVPTMNSDHGSSTTNSFSSVNGSSPANSSRGSYPSHMEHDDEDSNKIAIESEQEDDEGITVTTDVPQELTTTPKTPIPVSLTPVASSSSSSIRHQQSQFKLDQLKRSVSTTSIKSNKSSSQFRPAPTPLARIRDENEPAESRLHKQQARKSMSMDDMQSKLDINESSVTSSALDWINEDSRPSSRIKEFLPIQNQADAPLLYQQAKPSKSRGLFGSLRQVSRSKTHHHSGNAGGVSSLKGLVRNFSTSHQTRPNNLSDSNSCTTSDTTGMSRAAMAVIQHNVAKHEQKKASPVIPDEKKQDELSQPTQQKARQRAKSDANNSSGSRLIAQLLSRASSSNKSRRNNSTKIVNMEEDSAAKQRAQVVRKTIIYVQPDSLHNLLKNGGDGSSIKVPPVPRPTKPQELDVETRNTMLSDGSLSPDDDTIRSKEYFTATKVSRQTSVRKRVVETQEENTTDTTTSSSPLKQSTAHTNDHTSAGGMLSRSGSRRRWQLQSMDEEDILSSSHHNEQKTDNYMEGVELREMSDGSVVWGVVKKQGNRKSFYAPNKQNQLELVEDGEDNDDEEIAHGEDYFRNKFMKESISSTAPLTHLQQQQQQQQALPPPIPRRSPRRQIPADPVLHTNNNTKTDIFYSDQVTLPSLLRMMQEQQDQHEYPGDISEEDEQDDMQQYLFNERAMSSVDDQLDEMMRILTAK